MKKLMSLMLVFCLLCLPATALADRHHHGPDHGHGPFQRKHSVNVSSNDGGRVSPAGHVMVREGESLTIHIRPHRGYRVAKVIVDGENVGSRQSYHFSHIHRSHRVHVVFAREHHWDDGHHHRPHH